MTEMQNAFKMINKLPSNVLMQFPSGKWGFVGSVDARLRIVRVDGTPITTEDIEKVRNFGLGFVKSCKTRVWDTKEDAEAALAALDE